MAWAKAGPGPSRVCWLWLGPDFEKAKAALGRAKAGAFGPSRAKQITSEEVVEHYSVGELWDDFGIVSDVIVLILSFFTTPF